jgi:hypothetical protein
MPLPDFAVAALESAAALLAPADRGRFLQLARNQLSLLGEDAIGEGSVSRVIRTLATSGAFPMGTSGPPRPGAGPRKIAT